MLYMYIYYIRKGHDKEKEKSILHKGNIDIPEMWEIKKAVFVAMPSY